MLGPSRGVSAPDPFVLDDTLGAGFSDVNGRSVRSSAINPAAKTLVLIVAGQSNAANRNPTLYVPTNSAVVDNFNIYDGATYNINGPLLGADYNPAAGPGNISARVADKFVTNAIFDRVILIPIAIGNTWISDWATGHLQNRIAVAIKRLAARQITPATTGATFAMLWMHGENDATTGTTQAAYQSGFGTVLASAQSAGFSGRIFVCKETWGNGAVSSTIQAAQAALVDNVTVFSGGDLDTLGASDRQADNTHFNDVGAAAAATIIYNAMHASGSPY